MKKASLIVIGTELTRGIIEDKHTSVVAKEITHMGINFVESILCPDDGTIKETLHYLIPHNDIVIVTGGLGPTSDDMTRASIADEAGVKLIKDEKAWSFLLNKLSDRAYGANEKQSYIPSGFRILDNPNGTAPGFWGWIGETLLISLPGPPREMRPMFYSEVLPLISSLFGLSSDEREEYSTFVIAEAKLEEETKKIDSTLDWGTRFQDYKISLYLSGGTKERRREAIEKLKIALGEKRLEEGDVSALSLLVDTLKSKGLTISAAESCTGGLAASLLTSIAGSSSYTLGGVVSYSPLVKEKLLGVEESVVERYGVVSIECALEMADGVRRVIGSDYSFSITGVAGPDKSEGKEVGTICFGFSGKNRESRAVTLHLPSWGRESVRRRSCVIAFILMRAFINGESIENIVKSWEVF